MGKERRQHQRFDVRWRGRVATPDRQLHDIAIHDVSLGGVAITFPHLVSVGTAMSLEFYARPRTESIRIRAKTVVAFNTILSDNRGAKLGLQFTSLSPEDTQALYRVLAELEEDAF